MLSLEPPYQVVGGVTLLCDHADPRVRYAIPSAPRLRQAADGRPDFSLVQYLGGGVGAERISGGLLTFTAELAFPVEDLAGQVDFDLRPVLFDAGTVEVIALGASNVTATEDEDEDGVRLDITILGEGRPALDVNNAITFQLILDASAAELVEKTLDAPDLPLVLIYRMQLSGLRPSYQVNITADWHKVYTNLENRLKANAYYVTADVDLAIEKALEDNDVRIDTTVFGPTPADRAAAQAARQQLLDWVLDRMFEPLVADQPSTAEVVVDAVDGVVSNLMRTVIPGVTYRLRALSQEQTRHFDIRLDETVAERREIVPQGTLGALFRRYRADELGRPDPGWPALRESLVQKVNLDGFPRIEVAVTVEDRFTADGVRQVDVDLRRPDGSAARALSFRGVGDRHHYLVNLLGVADAFDLPYEYRATVHFDPAHPFGPQQAVTSPWRIGRAADLVVDPRDAYRVESIDVSLPPTFAFDHFAAVVVDLAHDDQTERLTFMEATPQTWRFRHTGALQASYQYTVSYLRPSEADADDVVLPPAVASGDLLSLPHPAPDERPLQILVNLPLEANDVAFLEIDYADDEHGISFEERIDLAADQRVISRRYDIADGGPQTLRYRLTIFGSDGLLEGQWRETDDSRLVVDGRLLANRVVTVRPVGGTLTQNGLATVRITLQQRATDGTVRGEREIVWTDPAEPVQWETPLGDPPVGTIHAAAVFVDQNGFTRRLPEQATEAANVIVHLQRQELLA